MSEVPREAAGGVEVSRAAFAAIGVAAQASQILLVRELAAVSQGTELAAALVLGVWMAGAAGGSLLGRLGPPVLYAALLAAFVLPSLAAVRLGRAGAAAGEVLTLAHLFAVALVACLPVAALSGALFSSAAKRAADPGRAYAIEAAGAGAAGLLLSLALLPLVPAFALARAPQRFRLLLAPRGAIGSCRTAVWSRSPRAPTPPRAAWWRSFSRLRRARDARIHGSLAAVDTAAGLDLPVRHLLFSPDRGEPRRRSTSRLRHPAPRRVLLAGGEWRALRRSCATGRARRLPRDRPDLVSSPPRTPALPACRPARRVPRRRRPRVCAPRPPLLTPSSSSRRSRHTESNRWWTAGFYAEVRRALKPDGVFAGSVPSYGEVADGPVFAHNRLLF